MRAAPHSDCQKIAVQATHQAAKEEIAQRSDGPGGSFAPGLPGFSQPGAVRAYFISLALIFTTTILIKGFVLPSYKVVAEIEARAKFSRKCASNSETVYRSDLLRALPLACCSRGRKSCPFRILYGAVPSCLVMTIRESQNSPDRRNFAAHTPITHSLATLSLIARPPCLRFGFDNSGLRVLTLTMVIGLAFTQQVCSRERRAREGQLLSSLSSRHVSQVLLLIVWFMPLPSAVRSRLRNLLKVSLSTQNDCCIAVSRL